MLQSLNLLSLLRYITDLFRKNVQIYNLVRDSSTNIGSNLYHLNYINHIHYGSHFHISYPNSNYNFVVVDDSSVDKEFVFFSVRKANLVTYSRTDH